MKLKKFHEKQKNSTKGNRIFLFFLFLSRKIYLNEELSEFESTFIETIKKSISTEKILIFGECYDELLNESKESNFQSSSIMSTDFFETFKNEEVYIEGSEGSEALDNTDNSFTDNEDAFIQTTSTKTLKLSPHSMYCAKNTGDTVFGPRDEIYWSFSIGTDTGYKKKYISKEYGSQSDGKTTRLTGDDATPFNIPFNNEISLVIECWERDDTGKPWMDALSDALIDIGQQGLEAATKTSMKPRTRADNYTILAYSAAIAIGELINWARNDDDLIQERVISLNLDTLRKYNNTRQFWNFQGSNGHYRLFLDFHGL
jgi:hypothetical protein